MKLRTAGPMPFIVRCKFSSCLNAMDLSRMYMWSIYICDEYTFVNCYVVICYEYTFAKSYVVRKKFKRCCVHKYGTHVRVSDLLLGFMALAGYFDARH